MMINAYLAKCRLLQKGIIENIYTTCIHAVLYQDTKVTSAERY